jgi:hypothetical protein
MLATAQTAIAVIGIDIRKKSFHVVGLDSRGAIVLQPAPALKLGVQDDARRRGFSN